MCNQITLFNTPLKQFLNIIRNVASSIKNSMKKVHKMDDPENDKTKEFANGLDKIKKQGEIIDDIIDFKKNNIEIEVQTISKLLSYKKNHEYVFKMCEDIPINSVTLMNDGDYSALMSAVNSLGIAGEASSLLYEESKKAYNYSQHHFATAASLATMAYSDSTSVQAFSFSNPSLFPDGANITSEYEIKDEIEKKVEYVRSQLQIQFPSLKDEFDFFVNKYLAFRGNNSQYQDLIGGRSLFFFKMIFDFTEQHYGRQNSRLEDIKKFVFGSGPVISSTEPLLRACNELYRDMSTQDSSALSLKLGKVTPSYIESIFRRLIGNIATILDLRANYFNP